MKPLRMRSVPASIRRETPCPARINGSRERLSPDPLVVRAGAAIGPMPGAVGPFMIVSFMLWRLLHSGALVISLS